MVGMATSWAFILVVLLAALLQGQATAVRDRRLVIDTPSVIDITKPTPFSLVVPAATTASGGVACARYDLQGAPSWEYILHYNSSQGSSCTSDQVVVTTFVSVMHDTAEGEPTCPVVSLTEAAAAKLPVKPTGPSNLSSVDEISVSLCTSMTWRIYVNSTCPENLKLKFVVDRTEKIVDSCTLFQRGKTTLQGWAIFLILAACLVFVVAVFGAIWYCCRVCEGDDGGPFSKLVSYH